MKAILISIKPKHVADILNGKKILEIRKTMPKCDLPIDVYIYCTKQNDLFKSYIRMGYYTTRSTADDLSYNGKGKVVAKFTLNRIYKFCSVWYPIHDLDFRKEDIIKDLEDNCSKEEIEEELQQANIYFDLLESACLTRKELREYVIGTEWFYAWHIDNLVIFDRPKELSDFSVRYPKGDIKFKGVKGKMLAMKELTKAPQSWQFVEVLS